MGVTYLTVNHITNSIAPLLMPYRQAVERSAVKLPFGHELIHQLCLEVGNNLGEERRPCIEMGAPQAGQLSFCIAIYSVPHYIDRLFVIFLLSTPKTTICFRVSSLLLRKRESATKAPSEITDAFVTTETPSDQDATYLPISLPKSRPVPPTLADQY